ncbi:hypothetical protein L228DRAFT_245120 [Xylona heveae TC161]|uniref:Uncharacterized protein n=1 Tax=Xylona heveae (strain CBS 132557 / TC161) TaxID=1328760 RepID=A0A165I1F3_XYLHT|nr:hypothetical protein L228DRAFT_245120 [Xylona heveae TC161]KZF24221.1 hypothetical protein L228DRAFT_245120 [Xylona heveae TC161]
MHSAALLPSGNPGTRIHVVSKLASTIRWSAGLDQNKKLRKQPQSLLIWDRTASEDIYWLDSSEQVMIFQVQAEAEVGRPKMVSAICGDKAEREVYLERAEDPGACLACFTQGINRSDIWQLKGSRRIIGHECSLPLAIATGSNSELTECR